MRINNNVTAMNAHRMYTKNNDSVTKSVAKLSSGYRINSAADDAAGLAISEKMRAQIRGLTMASKNSQDAVSLVQTAEGALQETHNILQRMRELAVQSGSDTNETSIDRKALNAEFQQLKAEIDDIARTTRFNDQNLIDGTFSAYKSSASAETTALDISNVLTGNAKVGEYTLASVMRTVGYEAGNAPTHKLNTDNSETTIKAEFAPGARFQENTTEFNKDYRLTFDSIDTENDVVKFKLIAQDGSELVGTVDTGDFDGVDEVTINFGDVGELTLSLSGVINAGADNTAAIETAAKNMAGVVLTGMNGANEVEGENRFFLSLGDEEIEIFAGDTEVEFRSAGVTLVLTEAIQEADLVDTDFEDFAVGSVTVAQKQGQSLVIQSGANEGDNLAINLDKMNTNHLGIYTTSIETRQKASSAITYVNAALNTVSTQRAELGALANRLEHKIANLDTSAENLQAAEGRIRDVDMAKEMTNFTKANILAQASTAMLAQANALPQGVLQLLG